MSPDRSPFPAAWWGISLESAGLAAERPDLGTYGRYEYDRLPPVPFDPTGDFAWLEPAAAAFEASIAAERADINADAAVDLRAAADRAGVSLPPAFLTFAETPALAARVRSATDCFLDVCPALVPSPAGGGHLVRFLADSQGCLFWYLYLTPGGADHAVVVSPQFFGTPEEEWKDESDWPPDIAFCAESFEAFVWRFWLENEIAFAGYDGDPVPAAGAGYIARYRAGG